MTSGGGVLIHKCGECGAPIPSTNPLAFRDRNDPRTSMDDRMNHQTEIMVGLREAICHYLGPHSRIETISKDEIGFEPRLWQIKTKQSEIYFSISSSLN